MDVYYSQEFDTPVNLYAKPDGIFRGMCEQSAIMLDDIKLAGDSKTSVDTWSLTDDQRMISKLFDFDINF